MAYYLKIGTSLEWSYKDILQTLLNSPRKRETRGTKSVELSPFVWSSENPLENILTNKVRNINRTFSVMEFLWIMSGRNDVEMLKPYNKNLPHFSDNGIIYDGAYGPKIRQQFDYVISKLTDDPGSRQAIITIWERNPTSSKDIPCTINFQFLNHNGRLDMQASMRSNDAWLGFPYDVYNFTMIQNYVAFKLGLKIGYYTHVSFSEHLYEQNFEKAREACSFPTMVSDIKSSAVITKDQLVETLDFEKALRYASFVKHRSFLDDKYAESQAVLISPWREMLELIYLKLNNF